MFKKPYSSLLASLLIILTGCSVNELKTVEETPDAQESAEFIPGTYTATAPGFGGDITVTITVDETRILDASITADGNDALWLITDKGQIWKGSKL